MVLRVDRTDFFDLYVDVPQISNLNVISNYSLCSD